MNFTMFINFKMLTTFSILTFISMMDITSVSLKARNNIYFSAFILVFMSSSVGLSMNKVLQPRGLVVFLDITLFVCMRKGIKVYRSKIQSMKMFHI